MRNVEPKPVLKTKCADENRLVVVIVDPQDLIEARYLSSRERLHSNHKPTISERQNRNAQT
jgi:hypothetical protein